MQSGSLSAEQLSKLFNAAAEVVGQHDLREVLEAVMSTAMELTGARYAAIGMFDESGGLLEFMHHGLDEDIADAIGHAPKGAGLLGVITNATDVVRINNVTNHPMSIGFPESHPLMESFIGVPLRSGEQVLGNLYLTDKAGGFDEGDELTVQALAVVGAAAASNAKLHERLSRLVLIEERERIARDVHDGVIQDLFAVGLGLKSTVSQLSDDEIRRHCEGSIDRLDECITALRSVIFDLRTDGQAHDLLIEVRELVEELAEPYPADVAFRASGVLPKAVRRMADTVLAMAKEAVSNALRHSECENVWVSVTSSGGNLHLSVEDDGRGFDPSADTVGMGLGNLRGRAAEVGGEFAVESELGVGTTVRIRLPY